MKASEAFPRRACATPDIPVREIVGQLTGNVLPLCQHLLPQGRREGAEWRCGSVQGEPGQSLGVHLTGTKTGVWSDFAAGGGGDLLDLIQACLGLDKGGAVSWAKDWLGIGDGGGAPLRPRPQTQSPSEWRPTLPAPCPPPHHPHHSRLGRPAQVWSYHSHDGQLLFLVCRFDKNDGGKDILPFSYGVLDGIEGWHWKGIPDQRPLYGLARLQASPKTKVLLVEGEKTADAAQRLLPSLVAVTWQGGGKVASKTDWSPLKGREVLIWPDADKPGRETAEGWHTPHGEFKRGLVHYLSDAGAAIRIIEPPSNVKDGWDLADAEAEGWNAEQAIEWIRENMRQAVQPSGPIPAAFNPQDDKDNDPTARGDVLENAKVLVGDLVERAKTDKGAPFEPDVLSALAILRQSDQAAFQRVREGLKKAGISRRDLDREIQKQNLHVINGGATDSDGATERVGPYKVISNVISHEKRTPDGPVTMPLCNFNVRIVGEEIRDDGAERITIFSIEGLLQNGKPLPKADVPADRYSGMNWVTTNWGTAPVIFAGQGARDHLRVAIQLLSGQVPRRTVFGHLGWRQFNGEWKYLHAGGAIGPVGPDIEVQVQTSDSRLSLYALPEPPAGEELNAAIQASLAILDLGPHAVTCPLLCTVYRAPLGEVAALDFTLFLAGPTGAQKTELTVLGQAHYGAGFNGKNLPGNWATTANGLEKQAFLRRTRSSP